MKKSFLACLVCILYLSTLLIIKVIRNYFSGDRNHLPSVNQYTPSQDHSSEGDEPHLTPIGHQGIDNIGNTCYMAATLQPIIALYQDLLRNMGTTDLAISIGALLQAVTDPHTAKAKIKLVATNFYHNIQKSEAEGGIAWPYAIGEQSDPVELLAKLLHWMKAPSIQIAKQWIDPACHRTRNSRPDTSLILHGNFPDPTTDMHTMQYIFDNILQDENVEMKWEEADSYYSKVTLKKILKHLNSLHENVLVVHVERWGDHQFTKISKPFDITITQKQSPDLPSDQSYQLVSFIQQVVGRHYIAYVKHGNQWVRYNDALVQQISDHEAEQQACAAYVFFYQPTAVKSQQEG